MGSSFANEMPMNECGDGSPNLMEFKRSRTDFVLVDSEAKTPTISDDDLMTEHPMNIFVYSKPRQSYFNLFQVSHGYFVNFIDDKNSWDKVHFTFDGGSLDTPEQAFFYQYGSKVKNIRFSFDDDCPEIEELDANKEGRVSPINR